MNMKSAGLAVFTVLLLATLGNAQKPKKFKAVQFLQMLNQTFGMQALRDLNTELRKALDLPPMGAEPSTSAAAPTIPTPTAPTPRPLPPNCKDHPFIEGTTITYFSERRALGTKALIQCDTGYVGSLTQTKCILENGQPKWNTQRSWEGCKPVDCGRNPPTVINAKPLFTETTFGSLVSYECLNGYKTSAIAANVTCGVNPKKATEGKWSNPIFSCDIKPQLNDNNNMMAQFAKMLGANSGSGGNNNMIAKMMAQMGANNNNKQGSGNPMLDMLKNMVKQQAPTTTPKPPQPAMAGGMNLPPHLQGLLPSGGGSAGMPQISARNLATLKSMGLGAGGNPMLPGGSGMNIGAMISNPSALFGGAGPGASLGGIGGLMGAALPGMGGPKTGPGGKPMDPEAMQERNQDMMMQQMMMQAMMGGMNRNNQKKQQQQGGEGAAPKPPANPLAAMFPGMQMPGMPGGMGQMGQMMMMQKMMGGGGEGKPMGGGLFGQMNPAALLGGGGGGGGMFNLFGGGAK